jgi:hypothetical protein
MGRSIFADESGDESVQERRTEAGRQSVFRDPAGVVDEEHDPEDGSCERTDPSVESRPVGDDDGDDATDRPTMTVFSGDEVYEIGVDDA